MSDTPLTDEVENTPSFCTYNKMLSHAHRLERDRAHMLRALQRYERDRALLLDALKATVDCLDMNGFGKAYAMDVARGALAELGESE